MFILFKFSPARSLRMSSSSTHGQDLGLVSRLSEGSRPFLQRRLAVPDPQLVCSFQGLLAGVIENVCKIRPVVIWASREAFHS